MKHIFLLFSVLAIYILPAFSQESSQQCSLLKHDEPVWTTEFMDEQWFLIRGNGIDSIKNDMDELIKAWNVYSDIDVSLIEVKAEYVHLSISDSNKLTQSLGTTGAMTTLATLVYTLTEHPTCNHLYLDFEEGDHAGPGIYSRADYIDNFTICY